VSVMNIEFQAKALECFGEEKARVPLEKFTSDHWRSILDRIPNYAPNWFRCLTMEYKIAGAAGYCAIDPNREHLGICELWRPSAALNWIFSSWPVLDIRKQGFTCFADGKDGNLWMFSAQSDDDSPLFFLELTAWDGGELSEDNGLLKTGLSMAMLLHQLSQASNDADDVR